MPDKIETVDDLARRIVGRTEAYEAIQADIMVWSAVIALAAERLTALEQRRCEFIASFEGTIPISDLEPEARDLLVAAMDRVRAERHVGAGVGGKKSV